VICRVSDDAIIKSSHELCVKVVNKSNLQSKLRLQALIYVTVSRAALAPPIHLVNIFPVAEAVEACSLPLTFVQCRGYSINSTSPYIFMVFSLLSYGLHPAYVSLNQPPTHQLF
jgi:hypothetical protein